MSLMEIISSNLACSKQLSFFTFLFLFLVFLGSPVAYGISQARGQIGVVALELPAYAPVTATWDLNTAHGKAGSLT